MGQQEMFELIAKLEDEILAKDVQIEGLCNYSLVLSEELKQYKSQIATLINKAAQFTVINRT